ncbi:mechanosensitive ion channel family protein [Aquabacterium sp.]|uniref:mechanosensitive ion channel family protein n=1 Tax=Aquabacterium sp. TaxID=1872578 RepID=UPI0035B01198
MTSSHASVSLIDLRVIARIALSLACGLGIHLAAASAHARPAPHAKPVAASASASASTAAEAASTDYAPTAVSDTPATLRLFNRDVAVLRAELLHNPPAQRVQAAEQRILARLQDGSAQHLVSLAPIPYGYEVQINSAMMFIVTHDDVDALAGESTEAAAQHAAAALETVIRESSESQNLRAMLHASGLAAGVTAIYALLLWLARRGRRSIERWAVQRTELHGRRLAIAGLPLVQTDQLLRLARRAVRVGYWALLLLMLYSWLGFVLERFPYTRAWGEQLRGFLLGVIGVVARGIVSGVPGLLVALVIFLLARFVVRSLANVFDRVQRGQLRLGWLDADVVGPTRRLTSAIIWLFALAMAYPYLPGAQTEAFKGLSVLVGLMLSMGASGLVGQAASGVILTFSRVFRVGEYVRVGEHEGTVTELGTFATRIRTGLGEELSLPNALILGAVTKNYSRTVNGPGYVLDTVVTIGYDTPWRQVHAMLIDAAHRTEGVLDEPKPAVFQTALSDFYVEYRLVCQAIPSQPRPRAEAMNRLHAAIQDVFNEHGVQIMSPHYRADPEQAKVVAPADWYPPPAQRP